MPALDEIAADYDVSILAIGGKGDINKAGEKANEWMPSGAILWGYDDDNDLWSAFGITGTPTNVFLLSDGTVLGIAPGALPEDNLRDILAELATFG